MSPCIDFHIAGIFYAAMFVNFVDETRPISSTVDLPPIPLDSIASLQIGFILYPAAE